MTGPARRRLPALAALVLLSGWLLAPSAPPLYDGIGFPDEPYRYVVPPAGPGLPVTPPPSEARDSSPLANGTNTQQMVAQSAEQGPQVLVSVSVSVLRTPPGAARAELTARPIAASDPPAEARLLGNVYRVGAAGDGQPVPIDDHTGLSVVVLRAPSGGVPGTVMEFRPEGGQWRRLATAAVGADVFQAQLLGAGDYAMAALSVVSASARTGSGGPNVVLLVVGLLVLAMAAVVLLLRLRGARSSP
ncbi:MAG: hypothetical protein NVSMB13_01540 [Mycobacteriales bacterium]